MYDPLGGLLNPQPKKKDPFAGIPKAPSASKFAGIPKASQEQSLTPKQAPSFTDWMMEQATAPLKQAGEGIMNFAGGTMDVLGKTAQGDIGGALQGVGRTLGGFGQIATSPMAPAINAGRNLPQFVQDTIQTAKPSFEKTLAGAGQVGRGFQQGNVKDVVYGGAKALSGGIGTAFSPVGGMMAQLPREIQQGAGVVGQGFSALRGAVPALTGQTGTETGEFMGDVFDIGMTALPFAGKGIAKAIGKTKTGQAIKEGANMFKQDIAQGYAKNIQPNLQAINRAVKAPVDVALNRFGELPGKARPLVGKATSGLVNQFYGIPEKAQKTIMSGNKYMKMADDGAFNEQIFLETAVKSIKDRKQALATTGKEYNAIRQSPVKAQIPEDVFASTLEKDYGLQVKNGKILYDPDTARIPIDPETLRKLQNTYSTYRYNPGEVSMNRLLNTRKGLDNMSKWDASVDYGTLGEIARKVRQKLDSYSPKELKSIDAKYAPEVRMLGDVEKYLLDPKGRIKDSAESFISNLGGKGKTEQLKKLSKVIPDLEAQVDAITTLKALERAQGSYAGGSQAVKGMLTGGVLGGATAMANPLLGIPATMAGMMLSNPKIGTALLKGASKMKGKLNLPTPQTPSTTTMKQALQQSGQELSTVGRNIKSGAKSVIESQKGLKGGFIDTDLLTGKKPATKSIAGSKTVDTLVVEAKKYKSAEEFVKEQGIPVYHGGGGVDKLNKSVKILSPKEKMAYPSSGGGYIGLSTTGDKKYAQQFSTNIAGRKDVAEMFINPKARIKEIIGGIDEMSPDHIVRLSKEYDVLKSIDDNEYRILNADVVKTKSQLTNIWNQAHKK